MTLLVLEDRRSPGISSTMDAILANPAGIVSGSDESFMMTGTRTAAQILVDALKIHGVDTAFCVPGESYLQCDALYDARVIRLVVARRTAAPAYMAEPGPRSPGARDLLRHAGARPTNASIGVHTAQQDPRR